MSGDALKEYASGLMGELTRLAATQDDNGHALFGSNTVTYDLGQGSGTVTLSVNSASGGIKSLSDALATLSAGTNITNSDIEDAQSELLGDVMAASAKAALFENRYNSLNDLITSYKNASDDQVINGPGNSTSLLNNLIG